MTFQGAIFDSIGNTTEFDYCIENLGGQALSHWLLEACFPPNDLLACTPAPCFYQIVDPTTGVTGVKFGEFGVLIHALATYSALS